MWCNAQTPGQHHFGRSASGIEADQKLFGYCSASTIANVRADKKWVLAAESVHTPVQHEKTKSEGRQDNRLRLFFAWEWGLSNVKNIADMGPGDTPGRKDLDIHNFSFASVPFTALAETEKTSRFPGTSSVTSNTSQKKIQVFFTQHFRVWVYTHPKLIVVWGPRFLPKKYIIVLAYINDLQIAGTSRDTTIFLNQCNRPFAWSTQQFLQQSDLFASWESGSSNIQMVTLLFLWRHLTSTASSSPSVSTITVILHLPLPSSKLQHNKIHLLTQIDVIFIAKLLAYSSGQPRYIQTSRLQLKTTLDILHHQRSGTGNALNTPSDTSRGPCATSSTSHLVTSTSGTPGIQQQDAMYSRYIVRWSQTQCRRPRHQPQLALHVYQLVQGFQHHLWRSTFDFGNIDAQYNLTNSTATTPWFLLHHPSTSSQTTHQRWASGANLDSTNARSTSPWDTSLCRTSRPQASSTYNESHPTTTRQTSTPNVFRLLFSSDIYVTMESLSCTSKRGKSTTSTSFSSLRSTSIIQWIKDNSYNKIFDNYFDNPSRRKSLITEENVKQQHNLPTSSTNNHKLVFNIKLSRIEHKVNHLCLNIEWQKDSSRSWWKMQRKLRRWLHPIHQHDWRQRQPLHTTTTTGVTTRYNTTSIHHSCYNRLDGRHTFEETTETMTP